MWADFAIPCNLVSLCGQMWFSREVESRSRSRGDENQRRPERLPSNTSHDTIGHVTSVTKAVVKVIRNGEAWERDGGNTRGFFRTNIRSVGVLLHVTLLGIHIKVFVMEKCRQLMDTTDNRQENGVKTCTAGPALGPGPAGSGLAKRFALYS